MVYLECPGIQDVEVIDGVLGGGGGVTHARGQQGQQGCGREEERTVFPRFHGVGGWSCDPLNRNAPLFCRPAHRPKNGKKCDETVKKRGEPATGAFFEPKKRGGIAMPPLRSAAAVHGRAANGCSGLPRHRPRSPLTFSRLSAVGKNAMACLFVGSPLSPARPGKIFHRGPNFYLTRLSPQLGCT